MSTIPDHIGFYRFIRGLTILFHSYYVNNQMIAYFDEKISPIIAARVKNVSYNEKYRVN